MRSIGMKDPYCDILRVLSRCSREPGTCTDHRNMTCTAQSRRVCANSVESFQMRDRSWRSRPHSRKASLGGVLYTVTSGERHLQTQAATSHYTPEVQVIKGWALEPPVYAFYSF